VGRGRQFLFVGSVRGISDCGEGFGVGGDWSAHLPGECTCSSPAAAKGITAIPGATSRLCCPHCVLQGDAAACSGEVVAAGDARTHQQALELLSWQR
jgi:hypothetical protein